MCFGHCGQNGRECRYQSGQNAHDLIMPVEESTKTNRMKLGWFAHDAPERGEFVGQVGPFTQHQRVLTNTSVRKIRWDVAQQLLSVHKKWRNNEP